MKIDKKKFFWFKKEIIETEPNKREKKMASKTVFINKTL